MPSGPGACAAFGTSFRPVGEMRTMTDLISILHTLSVPNRDNGRVFTDTERLDAIAELLRESPYERVAADGLFHMYSRVPIEAIEEPVVIVSTHVDCEYHITKCFTKQVDDDTLLGTFDNSITNASAVHLMLSTDLPDNVLFAFTGDEEEGSRGATDVARFVEDNRLEVLNIYVLDVTEVGWKREADFTVENDFWDDDFGKRVVDLACDTGYQWRYVPAYPDDIPSYVPKDRVKMTEAYEDESWEYDERDLPCFSLCLPTKGDMHCDDGILARTVSFRRYTEVLGRMLKELV